MAIFGYCRISRNTQNIERQVRNILAYEPKAKVVREIYTGTTQERKQWKQLIKDVEPGDTIIFDSVSRMSRNVEEGFAEYQRLYNDGITLVFMKEPHINTAVYKAALSNSIAETGNEIADEYIKATNRVLMILARDQIKLAFEQAQKEVDDLHQRTIEGIQTARLAGKQIGQRQGAKLHVKKAAPAKEIIRKHSKTFGGSLNDKEVIALTGLARNTYYKYKAALRKGTE